MIPCKYDWIGDFSAGLAVVKLNGNFGLVNFQGEEVIPLIYQNMVAESVLIIVQVGHKYGAINYSGEYILPCQYDRIDLNDDVIVARKSNTRYEFNQSGELVKIFCD